MTTQQIQEWNRITHKATSRLTKVATIIAKVLANVDREKHQLPFAQVYIAETLEALNNTEHDTITDIAIPDPIGLVDTIGVDCGEARKGKTFWCVVEKKWKDASEGDCNHESEEVFPAEPDEAPSRKYAPTTLVKPIKGKTRAETIVNGLKGQRGKHYGRAEIMAWLPSGTTKPQYAAAIKAAKKMGIKQAGEKRTATYYLGGAS